LEMHKQAKREDTLTEREIKIETKRVRVRNTGIKKERVEKRQNIRQKETQKDNDGERKRE
jgi:hypothetical protein